MGRLGRGGTATVFARWTRGVAVVLAGLAGLAGRATGVEYYAATNGTGTPGTNWVTAFTNLPTALAATGPGDTLYLAGHRFRVTNALALPSSGVTILGGYQGVGLPGTNNPATWPTVIQRSGTAVFGVARIVGKTGIVIRAVTLLSGGGYANGHGGGLFAQNAAFTLANSTVISNSALEGGGGGIYLDTCTATITNCTVAWNASWTSWGGTGGGIHVKGGVVRILDSTIRHNYANAQNLDCSSLGGGLHVESGSVTVRHTRVHDNWLTTSTGPRRGHGVYLAGGSTLMDHCVVATNRGEGICYAAGTVAVRNSILWNNGDDLVGFATNGAGTLVDVSFCDVEDGDNSGRNGCFSSNPLFVNYPGRDFHLQSLGGHWSPAGWVQDYSQHSPCIDTGDTNTPYAAEPAPNGTRPNIGAYGNTAQASKSFPPHPGLLVTTRPVAFSGGGAVTLSGKLWSTGAGDSPRLTLCWGPSDGGTNGFGGWAHADYVGSNTAAGQIFSETITNFVSGATYVFRCHATNSTGQDWSDYPVTFQAPFLWYVSTLGSGGPGTTWGSAFTNVQAALDRASTGDVVCLDGNTFRLNTQLVWTDSVITVRGGYQGVGAPGSNNPVGWPTTLARSTGNSRVLLVSRARNARMENVTIAGGSLNTAGHGGGILVTNSGFTLAGSTLCSNAVFQANGGGLCSQGSTLVVTSCVIYANTTWGSWGSGGGGICTYGTNVVVRDTVIRNNQSQAQNSGAGSYGGGIYVAGGAAQILNCVVRDNILYTYSAQNNWFGNGIYLAGGNTLIRNCTVATNRTATTIAGPLRREGIRYAGGSVTLADSIIWHNEDDLVNFPVNGEGFLDSVRYCDIEDGDNAGVNGCISLNPLFVDAAGRDYHLKSVKGHWIPGDLWVKDTVNSPCLDAGDPDNPFDREPLPNGGRGNMGAYGNSPEASKSVPRGTVMQVM